MSSSSNSIGSVRSIGRCRPALHCSTPSGSHTLLKPRFSISTVEEGSFSGNQEKHTSASKKRQRKKKSVLRRKRKKQKLKSARKKARCSSSDWETKSERSVLGHVSPERNELTRIPSDAEHEVLFEDIGSPESLREAVYPVEECVLVSPSVGSRREQALPLINESLEEPNAPLPLKNVQFLSQQDSGSTDDEEECQLRARKRYRVDRKTYSRPVRQSRYVPMKHKHEDWLVPLRPPVAASNLLWDDFIKNYPEQFRRILESESSDEVLELEQLLQQYYAVQRANNIKSAQVNDDQPTQKRSRRRPMKSESPKTEIIRGWWDRSRNEWVRDYPTTTSSDEDDDVQILSCTQRTITPSTFSKFRAKCNKPTIRSEETLTTLKYERIDRKKWKIIKK